MTRYDKAWQLLADHDRTFFMSDASNTLRKGYAEVAAITEALDGLEDADVARLADEFYVQPIDAFIAMRFEDARKRVA